MRLYLGCGDKMEKVRFGYSNRIDKSTLTGGSWQAPLTNIQTPRLAQRARSLNATNSSTIINIKFDKEQLIEVFSLHAHNISVDGRVRVFAGSSLGKTDLYDSGEIDLYDSGEIDLYDSGEIEVWPPLFSTLSLHWKDYHFWSGKIGEETRKEYQHNFIHILKDSVKTKYFRVEIFDQSNTDGYVEIGRIFAGRVFEPQFNVIYGAQLAWEDSSKVDQSLIGVEYASVTPMVRVANVNYDYSFRREALEGLYEIQRRSGITQEVLFIGNSDDLGQMDRLSFLGRFRKIEPIKWHFMDLHSTGFEIKEIL